MEDIPLDQFSNKRPNYLSRGKLMALKYRKKALKYQKKTPEKPNLIEEIFFNKSYTAITIIETIILYKIFSHIFG